MFCLFSRRRRHTRCALVTGVQTCALPIYRYFYSKLRAAHVANDSTIRIALCGTVGVWFAPELFLEADVDKLIADAKAKPKRSGVPKKYDYTGAIISLIDHHKVRALDI